MSKKSLKIIIISVIIVFAVLISYLIWDRFFKGNKEYNYLRDYEVNEYIPTYISIQDMVKIYLNDYLFYMRYNPEKAYELLDKEYKEKKFNSFEDFKNYINNLKKETIKLEKYSQKTINGYRVYTAYDTKGNVFIFKTDGVMQYRVLLDDKTVEVGD